MTKIILLGWKFVDADKIAKYLDEYQICYVSHQFSPITNTNEIIETIFNHSPDLVVAYASHKTTHIQYEIVYAEILKQKTNLILAVDFDGPTFHFRMDSDSLDKLDYITMPFPIEELILRIEHSLDPEAYKKKYTTAQRQDFLKNTPMATIPVNY
ncbi:MAG TPA: hypothetical protein VLL52_03195 [Anaerolineae bacterium]|nr:hypothetical protein [Anaerolineae bacterium]